ncbi:hypothetical protein ACFVUS_31055 [Nocardia sp. NPDC058058]|uniref:TY-Chap domain-containing protein n=1 Tax=Nocardia sp. NPDC058058 TaxID=3346317 RepID=UPI0036DE38EE
MGLDEAGEHAREEVESAVEAVWDWYSQALAWTLFTLPDRSEMALSTDCGYVQFRRYSSEVEYEVSSNKMLGVQRISAEGEALLISRDWEPPTDNSLTFHGNWLRRIRCPAQYAVYEKAADELVWALRDVLELPLPFELEPETYDFGIRGMALLARPHGYSTEQLRTADASQLRRFAQEGSIALAEDRNPTNHGPGWQGREGGADVRIST